MSKLCSPLLFVFCFTFSFILYLPSYYSTLLRPPEFAMNMSVNSSTISNDLLDANCFIISFYIDIVLCVLKVILIFPLSLIVLYLGHQRWRRQSSFNTERHSDVFSHHMAAMELIYKLLNDGNNRATYVFNQFLWRNLISCPHLSRALHGCYSPHYLHASQKCPWGQDQKLQHWLRLTVEVWID